MRASGAVAAFLGAICFVGAGLVPSAGGADFTFRRVGVPETGSAHRITVQITEQGIHAPSTGSAPASAGQAPPEPAPVIATSAAAPGTDWFWNIISPKLADTGPGRLELALGAMDAACRGYRNRCHTVWVTAHR